MNGQKPSPEEVRFRFLALRPHVALNPIPTDEASSRAQEENEASYCLLLVDRILPLLLPPEDFQNPCLDVLVSEIFADMVIRNGLCGKASEPWLVWDGITKSLHVLRPQNQKPLSPSALQTNRLEQFGLLASVRKAEKEDERRQGAGRFNTIVHTFWSTAQAVVTIGLLLRAFITALTQASSIPARAKARSGRRRESMSTSGGDHAARLNDTNADDPLPQPIICMRIWTCLSQVVSLEQRMPWLSGALSLLQWLSICGPGKVCCLDSRLDR